MNDVADEIAAKRALRRTMRSLRRELPEQASRSERLWDAVTAVSMVRSARVVMAFEAVPGEPLTGSFIEWCAGTGKEIVVPAADPAAEQPAGLDRIDVVIVPGLAFSPAGERLGQGGGWYDRLLAGVRADCVAIGVCFAEQVIDAVPTEPHDRRVDLVVSDAGVVDPC